MKSYQKVLTSWGSTASKLYQKSNSQPMISQLLTALINSSIQRTNLKPKWSLHMKIMFDLLMKIINGALSLMMIVTSRVIYSILKPKVKATTEAKNRILATRRKNRCSKIRLSIISRKLQKDLKGSLLLHLLLWLQLMSTRQVLISNLVVDRKYKLSCQQWAL